MGPLTRYARRRKYRYKIAVRRWRAWEIEEIKRRAHEHWLEMQKYVE